MFSITSEGITLKQKVITYIWPVTALFFVVYIYISFFISNDYLEGWILIPLFLFFIIATLIFLKTKKVGLIGNILAFIGIPVILPWLITGGPTDVGFWWSIVYVVWAFIVASEQSAIFWLLVHLVLSILIVILSLNGIVKIVYPLPELINLFFAYAITILYVYFLVRVLEYYLQLSNKRAAELSAVNKDLIAANNELEQFAFIASHHLQEPLRTIANYVEMFEKKYSDKFDEDYGVYLKFISSATTQMQSLIKDVMDFSRIGKAINFVNVNCNDILKEAITEVEASIKESKAKINVAILPSIKGSETELKHLFLNLISNAIKFRKKNVIPEIVITGEEKETEYLFAFKDNGIGIEEQYIPKLFIIFQRLHNADEYPGTGIGLAICKKIVAMHKGKIWVESKLGEGSTFYFTIPKENLT